jgi:large subunit ribosomal protein L7/L12
MIELEKQIELAKQKRDALVARLQKLEAKRTLTSKKDDTRRKILVGAFLLEKLEKGKASFSDLNDLNKHLDKFLIRKNDRKLFGLKVKELQKEEELETV